MRQRLIRDGTLRRFAKKDKEERRLESEVRTPVNSNENRPLGVIYMIAGGDQAATKKRITHP